MRKNMHIKRKANTLTHTRTQINRFPVLPSVICRSLGGVTVDCRLYHSWVKKKKEQYSRCLGCVWVSSYTNPQEKAATFTPVM